MFSHRPALSSSASPNTPSSGANSSSSSSSSSSLTALARQTIFTDKSNSSAAKDPNSGILFCLDFELVFTSHPFNKFLGSKLLWQEGAFYKTIEDGLKEEVYNHPTKKLDKNIQDKEFNKRKLEKGLNANREAQWQAIKHIKPRGDKYDWQWTIERLIAQGDKVAIVSSFPFDYLVKRYLNEIIEIREDFLDQIFFNCWPSIDSSTDKTRHIQQAKVFFNRAATNRNTVLVTTQLSPSESERSLLHPTYPHIVADIRWSWGNFDTNSNLISTRHITEIMSVSSNFRNGKYASAYNPLDETKSNATASQSQSMEHLKIIEQIENALKNLVTTTAEKSTTESKDEAKESEMLKKQMHLVNCRAQLKMITRNSKGEIEDATETLQKLLIVLANQYPLTLFLKNSVTNERDPISGRTTTLFQRLENNLRTRIPNFIDFADYRNQFEAAIRARSAAILKEV